MSAELVVALVSLIGSVIALVSSARTAHFQTISPMRKEWIGEFRSTLANFLVNARDVRSVFESENHKMVSEVSRAFEVGREHLKLMLNPFERLHGDFNEQLDLVFFSVNEKDERFYKAAETLSKLGQRVIKEAWDQVSKRPSIFPEFENY